MKQQTFVENKADFALMESVTYAWFKKMLAVVFNSPLLTQTSEAGRRLDLTFIPTAMMSECLTSC